MAHRPEKISSNARSRHIALVVHGARAERADLRHMVSWVRERGHHVEPLVSFEAGGCIAHAADAARRGADVVVAVGGDGTVNDVINGLDGHDVPLGIIPLGTANDFARQARIPLDADHAMDVILQRKPVRMDTASLNGRRFLNVSAGGVGAQATAETPGAAKDSLGPLAYAITGIRKLPGLRPVMMRVAGDDFASEGKFLMFAVGTARVTGGGAMLTPHASATDGLLDVCMIEAMPRSEFARLALRLKRGNHVGAPGVQYHRTRSVTIESAEAIHVNVDGEISDAHRLTYRARPGDLRVHVTCMPGTR